MRKTLSLSILLGFSVFALNAQAGVCNDALRQAQRNIFKNVGNVCADINTSPQDNSPFVYVNPDGGCDLGLQLPGLPTFGMGLGNGLDMCALAKTVTGGMVNQANSAMQGAMNTTIGTINQTTQQTIGTGVVNSGNVDISTILNQSSQQRAQEAASGPSWDLHKGMYQTPGYVP